jgi:hypothetical protein
MIKNEAEVSGLIILSILFINIDRILALSLSHPLPCAQHFVFLRFKNLNFRHRFFFSCRWCLIRNMRHKEAV